MRVLGAAELESALDLETLVERVREALRQRAASPPGQHYEIDNLEGTPGQISVRAAWLAGRHLGLRIATDFPDNPDRRLPVHMGAYLVMDSRSGRLLAMIDGPSLFAKRTAAVSALASKYLSRPDCERLLMVGCDERTAELIVAHAAVRPICNVLIWDPDHRRAGQLARRMNRGSFRVSATEDLESAVRGAHVICCLRLGDEPMILGEWLPGGVHLDLVADPAGKRCQVDDDALVRGRIFVDGRQDAAVNRDLTRAVAAGRIGFDDVAGDLYDLTGGERAGRRYYEQITLFVATDIAVADLAAARLAMQRL